MDRELKDLQIKLKELRETIKKQQFSIQLIKNKILQIKLNNGTKTYSAKSIRTINWRLRHVEKHKENCKKWYQKNREKLLRYQREKYQCNKK